MKSEVRKSEAEGGDDLMIPSQKKENPRVRRWEASESQNVGVPQRLSSNKRNNQCSYFKMTPSVGTEGAGSQTPTNASDQGIQTSGLLSPHPTPNYSTSQSVFSEVRQQESTQQLSPVARTWGDITHERAGEERYRWVFYCTLGNVSKAFVFFPHSFLPDPSDLPT